MTKSEILERVIHSTIKKANATMPNFFMDKIDESVVLYGKPDAILDSLNLVSFVFLLEEEVETVCHKKIIISTQDVLNTEFPPFASLSNLSDFILTKLNSSN